MKDCSASKKINGCLKTVVILACGLLLNAPALAEENIISSVMITKAKDKANAYELNIDSTQAVQYKANIEQNGNIYFDLKNSVLADDIGTIYDDVSDINNLIVKELDRNKVRIYVNGKNAKNTELVFVNSLFETTQKPTKKLIINRPINHYRPVVSQDLSEQEVIQEWDDNSFNISYLASFLFNALKDGPSGIAIVLLGALVFVSIIIKVIASKISSDKEPLIGLSSQKYLDNTLALGTTTIKQQMNKNSVKQVQKQPVLPQNNDDLASISHRNQTLRAAQAELAKAHQKYQEYLQNKYKDGYKAKMNSLSVDAVKKGIALSQYQKSTQNPYSNQEVIKMNKDFTQNVRQMPQGNFQIPPRPQMQKKVEFSSPYIQKPSPKMPAPSQQSKQGNMKFLESVTKIYEQSGRGDLASGLKNSISKAKQTI